VKIDRGTRRHQLRWPWVGALAVVCAVVVGACGSSGSSGNANGGGGASGAHSPIMVGTIAPVSTAALSYGGIFATLKAWATQENKHGGLNGHPIKTWTCNTEYQSAQELACARQAVSAGVDVMVGDNNDLEGSAYGAILSQAKIPDVENTGAESNGFAGAYTFPITWPLGTFVTCASSNMAQIAGGKKIVAVATQNAVSSALLALDQTAAKNSGDTWLKPIMVSSDTADYSSSVAQAQQSGAQTVLMILLGAGPQAFVRASSAVGAKYKICTALGLSGAGGFSGLGSAANNVFVGSDSVPVTTNTSAMKAFNTAMKAEQATGDSAASLSPKTYQAQTMETWLGLQAVQQAAATIKGSPTPSAITAALRKVSLSFGGIVPSFSFSDKPETGAGSSDPAAQAFAHVWNSTAYLWKWNPGSSTYTLAGKVPNTFGLASK
jgi:branched-chain amino acid transport system substrate-binding protein